MGRGASESYSAPRPELYHFSFGFGPASEHSLPCALAPLLRGQFSRPGWPSFKPAFTAQGHCCGIFPSLTHTKKYT